MDFVTQPNPRQFSLSSIREMFNHTTATGKSGIAATERENQISTLIGNGTKGRRSISPRLRSTAKGLPERPDDACLDELQQSVAELRLKLDHSNRMHTESLERRKKAEQELSQARSQCLEAEATIARLKLDIVNNYCTFDTTEELSKALEDVLTLRSELTALESRQCEGSESSQAALVHTRCLLQEAQAEVTRLREGKAVEPTAPSEQERQLSALVQRLQIELKDAWKMYAKQVEDLRKMLAKSEELAALRQAKIDELLGSMRSAATDVKTATELSSQQEDTIYRLRNELVHNQMAKDAIANRCAVLERQLDEARLLSTSKRALVEATDADSGVGQYQMPNDVIREYVDASELYAVRQQLKKAQREVTELRRQVQKAREAPISASREDMQALHDEITSLKAQLVHAKKAQAASAVTLSGQAAAISRRSREIAEDNEKLSASVLDLQKALARAREDVKIGKQHVADAQRAGKEALEVLQREYSERMGMLSQSGQFESVEALQGRVDQLERLRIKQERELSCLRQELKASNHQLEILEEETQAKVASLQNDARVKSSEISRLRRSLGESQQALQTAINALVQSESGSCDDGSLDPATFQTTDLGTEYYSAKISRVYTQAQVLDSDVKEGETA